MYVQYVTMYGWIPFCNRIIENKRNKTKKKKKDLIQTVGLPATFTVFFFLEILQNENKKKKSSENDQTVILTVNW